MDELEMSFEQVMLERVLEQESQREQEEEMDDLADGMDIYEDMGYEFEED